MVVKRPGASHLWLLLAAFFASGVALPPLVWPWPWVLPLLAYGGITLVLPPLRRTFRGLLWDIVAEEWNPGVALVLTAIVFGWGHLHGYPPGYLGAVLAGVHGLALGILRWWAGGLGLPLACHVCADATIFSLLLWSGAFGPSANP
jgi:membrane protease YdiL (CAAX protease family)